MGDVTDKQKLKEQLKEYKEIVKSPLVKDINEPDKVLQLIDKALSILSTVTTSKQIDDLLDHAEKNWLPAYRKVKKEFLTTAPAEIEAEFEKQKAALRAHDPNSPLLRGIETTETAIQGFADDVMVLVRLYGATQGYAQQVSAIINKNPGKSTTNPAAAAAKGPTTEAKIQKEKDALAPLEARRDVLKALASRNVGQSAELDALAKEIATKEKKIEMLENRATDDDGNPLELDEQMKKVQQAATRKGKIEETITSLIVARENLKKDFDPKSEIRQRFLDDVALNITKLEKFRDDPDAENAMPYAEDLLRRISIKKQEVDENATGIKEALKELKEIEKEAKKRNLNADTLEEIKDAKEALGRATVNKDPETVQRIVGNARGLVGRLKWDDTKGAGGRAAYEFMPMEMQKGGVWADAGKAITGTVSKGFNDSTNWLKSVWKGGKGDTMQTLMRYGGGVFAGIAGVWAIGKLIDNTPVLNWPGIKQLLKIGVFLLATMATIKFMEGAMPGVAQTSGKFGSLSHTPKPNPAEAGIKPFGAKKADTPDGTEVEPPADKKGAAAGAGVASESSTHEFWNKGTGKVQEFEVSYGVDVQKDSGIPSKTMLDPEGGAFLITLTANAQRDDAHAFQGKGSNLPANIHGAGGLLGGGTGGLNLPHQISRTSSQEGKALKVGGIVQVANEDNMAPQVIPYEAVLKFNQGHETTFKPMKMAI